MVPFTTFVQFVPAVGMLALAIFMLWKQPRGMKSQTFGVLMFLLAGRIIFHRASAYSTDNAELLLRVADAYLIALPASIFAFVLACVIRHPAWIIGPPLAVAAIMAIVHANNPCNFACGYGFESTFGPMAFLIIAWPFWTALAGLWLVIDALRKPDDPCSQAGLLVGTAFAVNSMMDGMLITSSTIERGYMGHVEIVGGSHLGVIMALMIMPLVVLTVVLQSIALKSNPQRIARYRQIAGLFLFSAAVVTWHTMQRDMEAPYAFMAMVRLLIPFMMAFALLRHRLFGIDVTIRWTISKTTIGAMFVAVFFIVSEIASSFLGDVAGNQYYGIVAASLLVFFWVPLQNVGERFAHSLLPEQSIDTISEKQAMYLRQAKLVWADGTMGVKERRILDQLAKDLKLDFSKAAELEHMAFESHGDQRKNLSASVA